MSDKRFLFVPSGESLAVSTVARNKRLVCKPVAVTERRIVKGRKVAEIVHQNLGWGGYVPVADLFPLPLDNQTKLDLARRLRCLKASLSK